MGDIHYSSPIWMIPTKNLPNSKIHPCIKFDSGILKFDEQIFIKLRLESRWFATGSYSLRQNCSE